MIRIDAKQPIRFGSTYANYDYALRVENGPVAGLLGKVQNALWGISNADQLPALPERLTEDIFEHRGRRALSKTGPSQNPFRIATFR